MSKSIKISLTVVLLFCLQNKNYAQSSISLNAAIDSALANNLTLKNSKLKAEYQNKLIKSGTPVAQTMIFGEYGQINSAYIDNKFMIAQSFNFPTIYIKQKNVLREEWQASVMNIAVKEVELKKNVSQLFYSILVLKAKEKLLLKNDSLYADFLQKIELLFSRGEINALEKASAISQRGQLHIQLIQLKEEIEIQQLQFQLLLNTSKLELPNELELKPIIINSFDSTSIANHPNIKLLEKQKQIASLEIKLQKSKLLPDLLFQYNNMSILGLGPDNVLYTSATRFKSAQIGLGLPLFYGAQKSKINASSVSRKIYESNYLVEKQNLEIDLQKTIKKYMSCKNILDYYDKIALQNATEISNAANSQIASGHINYLEWLMSINQNISIHNDYLNAIQNLNNSAILIQYYLTK